MNTDRASDEADRLSLSEWIEDRPADCNQVAIPVINRTEQHLAAGQP